MCLMEPRLRLRGLVFGLQEVIHFLAEGRLGEASLQLVAGNGLQDHQRVLSELPQDGVERAPQFVGAMIP
jgi:hypothetical protein